MILIWDNGRDYDDWHLEFVRKPDDLSVDQCESLLGQQDGEEEGLIVGSCERIAWIAGQCREASLIETLGWLTSFDERLPVELADWYVAHLHEIGGLHPDIPAKVRELFKETYGRAPR